MLKQQGGLRIKSINPKVFSLLLNVQREGNYLYVGVNDSLEDAYSSGVMEIAKKHNINPKNTNIDISMWNAVDGRTVMDQLSDKVSTVPIRRAAPSLRDIDECVSTIKKAQNELMERIVASGDSTLLEKNKANLNSYSYRYVKNKITKEAVTTPRKL